MLYILDDGTIRLTRGDTAMLTVEVVDINGLTYELSDTDRLTLTVKKKATDFEVCFTKTIVGSSTFFIRAEDTSRLEFKTYIYDVQLETAGGDVCTIIEPTKFVILPEVTY